MKIFKKVLCCLCALIVSGAILYADILFAFPKEITMYQHQNHNSRLGAGVSIGDIPPDVYASTSTDTVIPIKSGKFEARLKIANVIPFRTVKLTVTQPQNLNASGELIGLRLYNKGLIVTNLATVNSKNGEVCPAQKAGILPGDVILEINGVTPKSGSDVSSLLTKNTSLVIRRNNSVKTVKIVPATDLFDEKLKMGLWVRDSTAGVGTMTYLDPNTNTYGALGHSINDSDTGVLFEVQSGTIEKSRVVSVTRGKRGAPGEICGSFSTMESACGNVRKNCEAGIFGEMLPNAKICHKEYPIGVMSQVQAGKATIISTVSDKTEEYEIKILRSMPFGATTKGLAIEITDPKLLEKTGGIVQGMSGSPIIQNGKIIGAVTHVLVNDPTRGYGIFIENMLKEAG